MSSTDCLTDEGCLSADSSSALELSSVSSKSATIPLGACHGDFLLGKCQRSTQHVRKSAPSSPRMISKKAHLRDLEHQRNEFTKNYFPLRAEIERLLVVRKESNGQVDTSDIELLFDNLAYLYDNPQLLSYTELERTIHQLEDAVGFLTKGHGPIRNEGDILERKEALAEALAGRPLRLALMLKGRRGLTNQRLYFIARAVGATRISAAWRGHMHRHLWVACCSAKYVQQMTVALTQKHLSGRDWTRISILLRNRNVQRLRQEQRSVADEGILSGLSPFGSERQRLAAIINDLQNDTTVSSAAAEIVQACCRGFLTRRRLGPGFWALQIQRAWRAALARRGCIARFASRSAKSLVVRLHERMSNRDLHRAYLVLRNRHVQRLRKQHAVGLNGYSAFAANVRLAAAIRALELKLVEIPDTDCFSGENANQLSAEDLTICKRICATSGFGAFVVWQGKAYFRSHSSEECSANLEDSLGSITHLVVRDETAQDAGAVVLQAGWRRFFTQRRFVPGIFATRIQKRWRAVQERRLFVAKLACRTVLRTVGVAQERWVLGRAQQKILIIFNCRRLAKLRSDVTVHASFFFHHPSLRLIAELLDNHELRSAAAQVLQSHLRGYLVRARITPHRRAAAVTLIAAHSRGRSERCHIVVPTFARRYAQQLALRCMTSKVQMKAEVYQCLRRTNKTRTLESSRVTGTFDRNIRAFDGLLTTLLQASSFRTTPPREHVAAVTILQAWWRGCMERKTAIPSKQAPSLLGHAPSPPGAVL